MASVEGRHVAVKKKKTKSWVPSFQLILTQALLYTSYLNSNKERWQDAAFPALEKQVWSQRQCPHILVLVWLCLEYLSPATRAASSLPPGTEVTVPLSAASPAGMRAPQPNKAGGSPSSHLARAPSPLQMPCCEVISCSTSSCRTVPLICRK